MNAEFNHLLKSAAKGRISRREFMGRAAALGVTAATATHLRMRARLVAWEGEAEVFRRDWDEEVERRFL